MFFLLELFILLSIFISGRDWFTKFPYETPLSNSLSSPNQHKYASAILNMTGKENLGMNLDSPGLESSIIGIEVSYFFIELFDYFLMLALFFPIFSCLNLRVRLFM